MEETHVFTKDQSTPTIQSPSPKPLDWLLILNMESSQPYLMNTIFKNVLFYI